MSTISSIETPAWMPHAAKSPTRFANLWQAPLFLIGVVALVLVVSQATIRFDREHQEFVTERDQLRTLLATANVDVEQLIPRIQNLLNNSGDSAKNAGQAHLLMTKALLRATETGSKEQSRQRIQQAEQHLEQAQLHGVVPADRLAYWYRLGRALFRAKGNLNHAIKYLERSLPGGADNPAEGYGMLVKAHLGLPKPDIKAALAANEQQIKLAADDKTLQPALLLRAELLVRGKQDVQALAILEQIKPTAAPQIVGRANYLQATICTAEGLWHKAAKLWEQLLDTPALAPGGRQRILYILGRSRYNSSPPDEKGAIEAWSAALNAGGAEARAAALGLAELYLLKEPRQFAKVESYLKFALQDVTDPKDYQNTLAPLKSTASLLTLAVDIAKKKQDFAHAKKFALLCKKLFPPAKSAQILATTLVSWAETTGRSAQAKSGAEAQSARELAQRLWREAAVAWREAVPVQGARKSEFLWRAAACFRKGADHAAAQSLLEQFLTLPLPENKLAAGWYELAQVFQLLKKSKQAQQAYYKCIAFPKSECILKGRLRLAEMQIANGDLQSAEDILEQNLKDINSGRIDRAAYEESLYQLGLLQYQRGNHSSAWRRLQKAVRQFPDNSEALLARDRLADCFRKFARQEAEKAAARANVLPAAKQDALQKKREWLVKATHNYQQLVDELDRKKEHAKDSGSKSGLTKDEMQLLLKAQFALADIEFARNNFTIALRQYKTLADKNRGKLEELYAVQRIWFCCSSLKFQPKNFKAALLIVQATLPSVSKTLKTIPEKELVGPITRKQWQTIFQGVESQFTQHSTRVLRPQSPPAQKLNPTKTPSPGAQVPLPAPKNLSSNTGSRLKPPPAAVSMPPPPPPPSTQVRLTAPQKP